MAATQYTRDRFPRRLMSESRFEDPRRAKRSAHCSGGNGSRHQFRSCPVPDRDCLDDRIHTLALSPRYRFAPSC
jgi:hypothetical protein